MTGVSPVAFLERAVATPSHRDPGEMRSLLCETLRAGGADPAVDAAGNVVASRGEGSPHVLCNTHLDTVAPHVPPERGERDGTPVLRGRGACDAKGPLAAMVAAFLGVRPTAGRVTLAVTPDEETASTGAAALDVAPDACVVGEPTGLAVCTAARGRFEATVTATGRAAHAADPGAGENAVRAGARAVVALSSFDDDAPVHPTLGPPALTPTRLEGGGAANRVPDRCTVTVDRRAVPPETAAGFRDALAAHLGERLPEADLAVALADREAPFLEPFETPADAAVVRALRAAGAGPPATFGAATEASYFAGDAPTVVFGPGRLVDESGPVAHADREYVPLPAVERAADVLSGALSRLVG